VANHAQEGKFSATRARARAGCYTPPSGVSSALVRAPEGRYLHGTMPLSQHVTRQQALALELGDGITCDGLTRDFVMFQRRRGHRHSTDDLLTAWYATVHFPYVPAPRLLDLGSGIGSIGLSVLWFAQQRGTGAHLTAIEAQAVSFRLLQENVAANGVADDVDAIHGDLRDATLLAEGRTFDLVTGSPPYFDAKAGILSADSQRAHARFELRGDVRDYARAAAKRLAPDGRFVLCFPAVQRRRAEEACAEAGLARVSACDVVPREGVAPLFSLFAYARPGDVEGVTPRDETFVVRDRDGAQTAALMSARRCFGLDVRG
jgi:tRNA1Val (adenine37-N6)-methyltransferase